jgi:hypothetical protein
MIQQTNQGRATETHQITDWQHCRSGQRAYNDCTDRCIDHKQAFVWSGMLVSDTLGSIAFVTVKECMFVVWCVVWCVYDINAIGAWCSQ